MEKKKVKFLHSLRLKMVLAMAFFAFVTGGIACSLFVSSTKKQTKNEMQGYMLDLARAYGMMLNNEMATHGDSVLSNQHLESVFSDVQVRGVESSYAFVVATDGTVIYHPDKEKIGKPVENEVVKQMVAAIANGEKVANEAVTYEFKGEKKYAGIYVNEAQDFIIVVTADYADMFSYIKKTEGQIIYIVLLEIVIVATIGSLFAYLLVRPMNEVSELTVKVGNMDLTPNDKQAKLAKRKDEIGRMGRSLDYLTQSLKGVVENIKEKSAQVMDAANVLDSDASETSTTMEQVEQAVNDIAEGATTQAGETQRAEEQVIEMGNMVQETSDEVEKLLAFAQDMQECTSQASDILQALEKVNARAEEHIDIIAEQTNTTNEAAMKISEATHLITSIAEETNLLALNASIEAARAGEQGKGFGVVASEIQKLAEQTNESATHIEEIVQELLRDAEKAVETMYGVKEIMHTQSDHVEQTESAFEQVQSGVEQSIEGINRISEHTNRLNEARENVVGIVQNLTAIAEANAAGTEQTSASATEVGAIMEDITGKSTAMRQAAQELDDGMNIFKL